MSLPVNGRRLPWFLSGAKGRPYTALTLIGKLTIVVAKRPDGLHSLPKSTLGYMVLLGDKTVTWGEDLTTTVLIAERLVFEELNRRLSKNVLPR